MHVHIHVTDNVVVEHRSIKKFDLHCNGGSHFLTCQTTIAVDMRVSFKFSHACTHKLSSFQYLSDMSRLVLSQI